MVGFLNTESRPGPGASRIGGAVGKYVDRLLQLEWLQAQTVQGERAKGIKSRPSTAPGTSAPLKSPGRSKLLTSTLSKSHQEVLSKSGSSRKKVFHQEELHPSYYTFETSSKSVHMLSSSKLCAQKVPFEMRTDDKRKKSSKSTRLQHWDMPSSDSKIESNGNIRIPRPSAMILDPTDSCKASRTQAYSNTKKKGNTNNCVHSTLSNEKKLKTNGVKQSTYKFK
ncbi:protein FAM217B isoform X2 [Erinaceus europaeus]|nr:protein FAM217B isoform X2 [Erinaceus europaeus]